MSAYVIVEFTVKVPAIFESPHPRSLKFPTLSR